MAQKEQLSFKEKILEKIDYFFSTKAIIIWIFIGIIVVGVIAVFVWVEIDKSINEHATIRAEKVQEKYSEWIREKDEQKKDKIEEELLQMVGEIIKEYPNRYAEQRALSIRADVHVRKKEWNRAVEDYLLIIKKFSNTFIAPIYLVNAGICYEEMGDLDNAFAMYSKLVETYDDSFELPYALYSMGRIHEMRKDYSEAEMVYTQLEDEYTLSNWSKIAQNRKIYLKILEQQ